MIFNSFQFLWLFPIIFAGYYLIGSLAKKRLWRKADNILLLVISYVLYMQHRPDFALVLLGVTAITYFAALIIERKQAYGRKKYIIFFGALLALLPLLVFKYTGFISSVLTDLTGMGGPVGLNWVIPLGISFFTLQAVAYLFDVYYQRVKAEHDWWDYMLFVSFFPQILAGPISRAADLLPQIKAQREFNYNKAVEGMKWLLWGMFMKVVMADRLGIYVDSVLDNYIYNTGASCLVASFGYTFQIYGDFAGYSFMAMGVGKLMGFDLINNFRRPCLAVSVSDFWRRWHISFSSWLKYFVYIPLGGSRCSKPRNYLNLLLTFFVSGAWHGANWTYIVWGTMHGVFLIIEKILGLHKYENRHWWVIVPRIIITFILVTSTRVFFRMPSIDDAWDCIVRIFTEFGSLPVKFNRDSIYALLSIGVVLIVDIFMEIKPNAKVLMSSQYTVVRWATYLILTVAIVMFGVVDSGQFIYVRF